MLPITIGFIIITISIIIYLYVKLKMSFWKIRGIPFVEPVFPYGNLKNVGVKYHTCEVLSQYYNTFKNKLPMVGLLFYLSPVALILDLDLVKCVLIKDFHTFHERRFYSNEKDDPLSAHLFAISGEKWRTLRTKFTPTFTSGKMKYMFSTITEVGDRLVEKMKDVTNSDGSVVEIKNYWARYTTDIIGSCAFGIECNTLNDKNALFREMGRKIFEEPKRGMAHQLWINESQKLANFFGLKQIQDDVSEFFFNIVKDTITYRELNFDDRKDFMNLLIQLKNDNGSLSVEEAAAQSFVFFIAGFETSSTLLSFCSYELAINKKIQENARDEIKSVLEKYNGQFSYEAVMDMKYLDKILNETLRKYPPLTSLTRVASEDYIVPGTNYVIPKNCTVFIPVFSIHHDPGTKYFLPDNYTVFIPVFPIEIYSNPEVFDPNRFSTDEIKKRHPLSFVPFGEGQRNCIGLRFGMMQARVGLAKMLLNFQFSLHSKMKIPLSFSKSQNIIASDGGIWLDMERI